MPSASILPDPSCLELLALSADTSTITATVTSTTTTASCPVCQRSSTHVHSRYTRRLADLPWHGVAMRLMLHVRKFFCDNHMCERQIFTERLPSVVAAYGRLTGGGRSDWRHGSSRLGLRWAARPELDCCVPWGWARVPSVRIVCSCASGGSQSPHHRRCESSVLTISRCGALSVMRRYSLTWSGRRPLMCCPTAPPTPSRSGCSASRGPGASR